MSVVLYCFPVKTQSVSAQQLSVPAGWSSEFPVVSAGSSGPPSQPAVWHSGEQHKHVIDEYIESKVHNQNVCAHHSHGKNK